MDIGNGRAAGKETALRHPPLSGGSGPIDEARLEPSGAGTRGGIGSQHDGQEPSNSSPGGSPVVSQPATQPIDGRQPSFLRHGP